MIKTRTYARFILVIFPAVLIFLASCSTKKNTFTRRVYHNLTAHFNVYWNGMDNMRTGTKEFEATVKDNYALVIPVFNFGDKASAGKMNQYSDIAIKKASKAITKHSMYFSHKEYNRWIDDCYMLIGKAYFYKQDYPMARRTFEFIIKTYNTNDIKYEAMLWQAMSNMQLGDFSKAEPMLDMVQNMIKQGKAPEKYEKMLTLIYANFYILQKNYTPALEYLNRSLDFRLKRNLKTRVNFIIAQIHQKNGELDVASKYYETVVKRNPGFDMEFNAKINLAQCYMGKTGDRDFILKKLNKMLKDDKNKDYRDQIYYALSSISLRDGDTTEATKLLTKSVATSVTNNYQKAISSLDLADLYFAMKKYKPAQAYYDSTMQFLPKDFNNYKELKKKTETLTDLVTNLTVVEREDSLQKLAGMGEGPRNAIIDKIIAELVAEEAKKAKEEQERLENQMLLLQNGQASGPGGTMPGPGSGVGAGSWYFYNPSTLANGFSTFAKKWGRRKLEDDWFLSNKNVVSFDSEEKTDTTGQSASDSTKKEKGGSKAANDPKKRDFYLKDIPTTPEQIKASNDLLIKALYSLGFIYIEGLHDYERSIESFETLLTRFPKTKYTVASNYELYHLYKELGDQPKSDSYKNLILTNFPETDFAKLLVNPNYNKELKGKKKEATILYEDTYSAFRNQQYYMVINNCDVAKAKYPADSVLFPKFEYLKALSLGKIEVEDSLVSAMQRIIKKYPTSDVKPMAVKVLEYLGKRQQGQNGKPSPPGTDTTSVLSAVPAEQIYSYNPAAIHFFVLIVDDKLADVNALKIKISDFNTKYFDLDNLQINSILLDGTKEMITVNNFENAEKALGYFVSVTESKYIFTKLETSGGYDDFIISSENYPVFYKNRDVKQYRQFFEKYYAITK